MALEPNWNALDILLEFFSVFVSLSATVGKQLSLILEIDSQNVMQSTERY